MRRTSTKIAGALAALILIGALVVLRRPAADAVVAAAAWVQGLGWMAPVAFLCVFTLAVPLLIPAAPFLLASGILFGPAWGVLYGFVGNLLGGAVAFALARYLVRERIERRLAAVPAFAIMTESIRREGARGAALIRFSPAFPAWMINYGLGVSPISWPQYWASAAAILPTTVLYALAGSGLGDLAALEGGADLARGPVHYAFLAAGILATLAASGLLARRAKEIMETVDGR